eukprot:TRINITY_DN3687_c0_g1_i3.p1 TRINITY_DN3687_c0_g1~~TRINITY_DN3687_c0_g1_i3.p1  ORF type:complete len:550 (+),score=141.09 TRINITY_DN3687_c0_g1_i3:247-1650(+)
MLASSPDGKRTFFGGFSSQRMKDWDEIVTLYETSNIHLAELATSIAHHVNFELPAVKKGIARCQQLLRDYDRKEIEYSNTAEEYHAIFRKACSDLGVAGVDIDKEVAALPQTLPSVFDGVAAQCAAESVGDAVAYFQAFSAFVANPDSPGTTAPPGAALPVLSFLRAHGNVSAAVYRGQISLEDAQKRLAELREQATSATDAASGDTETPQINWDLDAPAGNDGDASAPAIDWDVVDLSAEAAGDSGDSPAINWDVGAVEISADGGEAPAINWDADPADASSATAVAQISAVPSTSVDVTISVLHDSQLRNQLITDLLQLSCFLKQRLSELNAEAARSTRVHLPMFEQASFAHLHTTQHMRRLLDAVNAVMVAVNGPKTRQLILLHSSPKYLARTIHTLRQKQGLAQKLKDSRALTEKKRGEVQQQLVALQPQVEVVTAQTKNIKLEAEKILSKQYNGRPVNIMASF